MKKITRSDEEKRRILAAIRADMAAGISQEAAAKKQNIVVSQIYEWTRKLSAAPRIIEHDAKEVRKSQEPDLRTRKKKSSQAFIVFGSPEELAAFAKEMQ